MSLEKNETSLAHEQIRRLGQLKHLYPDAYNCATALLEDLEGKMQPIEAIGEAGRLAYEIGEASGEKFWQDVQDAIETIQSEDEAEATVFYSNGGENGDPEYPCEISRYKDDSNGDFTVTWHSTDAWRGYYEVKAAKDSNWVLVHDDVILSMSEDEADLKRFDDFLRAFMDGTGVEYVRVFTRSSNVFSNGYDLFVEKKSSEAIERLIRILKPLYRDDLRFATTAITGKDPVDWEQKDLALTRIATALFDAGNLDPKVLRDRVYTELVDVGVSREMAEELASQIQIGGKPA